MAKHIKKRIASVKRSQRYLNYRESEDFSLLLDGILFDTEPLIDKAPKIAFELFDQFMSTHIGTIERADDSGGSIGESYRQGVEFWIQAASQWRAQDAKCKVDWQKELLTRHHENDYGIWDGLISNSSLLLSEAELKQLAWRFENAIRQALSNGESDGYNYPAAQAAIGLAGIARALSDVQLYERSVLLRSPEPNDLQKKSIIEFCFSINDGHSALKWLQTPWSGRFEYDRQVLLDKTLEILGKFDELIEFRREAYNQVPDFHNLQALLEYLPEADKANVLKHAVDNALQQNNSESIIDTLIHLTAYNQAAEHLLQNHDKLASAFYDELLDWAKAFTQSNHLLAAIACYRILLEQILDAGRAKAYGHAAKYYKKLEELDHGINSYSPLQDRRTYQVHLQEKHGRKSSFWSRVS